MCDDGANNSDTEIDACRTNCLDYGCGDAILDTGEGCDDGANNSDTEVDACRTNCSVSSCGDGICDTLEDITTCSADCSFDLDNISLGSSHSCGVRSNGDLYCWGDNINKQLGDGSTNSQNIPIRIGDDSNWSQVSSGVLGPTCGIRDNGDLYCWGHSANTYIVYNSTPIRVGIDSDWTHVSSGYHHICGIRNNGDLYCWGHNEYGQLYQ